MPNFRRFLSRRCVFAGVMLVIALPMMHPFVRQSIFGPTIEGIPWCMWEEEARRRADEKPREPNWFQQSLQKLGFMRRDETSLVNVQSAAALPLHIHLAEDRDAVVRRFALSHLQMMLPKQEPSVTPTLLRHLDDDDPACRLTAAQGVWRATKDLRVKAVLVPLLSESDVNVRRGAAWALADMAIAAPDLFDPLSKLAEDADFHVQYPAIRAMCYFGKRGLPILRKALHDPNKDIRHSAIFATSELRKDGMELTPILQTLETDPDPQIRRNAAHALYIMDPKLFAKPATWVD